MIICEGQDDLWFISYFLHKKDLWERSSLQRFEYYKIPEEKGIRHILYLQKDNKTLAVASAGGQDKIKSVVDDIAVINRLHPQTPIDKIVVFRDSDDRMPNELAFDTGRLFNDDLTLSNNVSGSFTFRGEESSINISVLPVIVPADEPGAIETVLMQSISDMHLAGKKAVSHANEFINTAISDVRPVYLRKQREITKAKYSATLSITNPTRSRDNFEELMMSIDWENSPSVEFQMAEIIQFINL